MAIVKAKSTNTYDVVAGLFTNKPVVLYNDATGTNGTVTLSETSANFTYLRIFFRERAVADSNYSSVDVYSPNGKYVSLTICQPTTLTTSYFLNIHSLTALISGTTITPGAYAEVNLTINKTIYGTSDSNVIYITRVEGYR